MSEMDFDLEGGSSKRTFTIQGSDLGFEGGRYKSKTPSLAAKKAAKQLFRMVENKDHKSEWKKYSEFSSTNKINFILREMTQGSKKDHFYYEGSVTKLKTPLIVSKGGVEITITKKINIKTLLPHELGPHLRSWHLKNKK